MSEQSGTDSPTTGSGQDVPQRSAVQRLAVDLLLGSFKTPAQRIASAIILSIGLAIGEAVDWRSLIPWLQPHIPPAPTTMTMYSYYFAGNDGDIACYEEEMEITFYSDDTVEATARDGNRSWDYEGVVHGNEYYFVFESTPETRPSTAGVIYVAPLRSSDGGGGEFSGFWFGDDLDYSSPILCPYVLTDTRRRLRECVAYWPEVFDGQTCREIESLWAPRAGLLR